MPRDLAVYAADLFGSAPPPMDEPVAQSELGSNWYIRGDVGYGQIEPTVVPQAGLLQPDRRPASSTPNQIGSMDGRSATSQRRAGRHASTPVPVTRANAKTSAGFDIGFGYRVNDWLRVEGNCSFSAGPASARRRRRSTARKSPTRSPTRYTDNVDGTTATTSSQAGYQW